VLGAQAHLHTSAHMWANTTQHGLRQSTAQHAFSGMEGVNYLLLEVVWQW